MQRVALLPRQRCFGRRLRQSLRNAFPRWRVDGAWGRHARMTCSAKRGRKRPTERHSKMAAAPGQRIVTQLLCVKTTIQV